MGNSASEPKEEFITNNDTIDDNDDNDEDDEDDNDSAPYFVIVSNSLIEDDDENDEDTLYIEEDDSPSFLPYLSQAPSSSFTNNSYDATNNEYNSTPTQTIDNMNGFDYITYITQQEEMRQRIFAQITSSQNAIVEQWKIERQQKEDDLAAMKQHAKEHKVNVINKCEEIKKQNQINKQNYEVDVKEEIEELNNMKSDFEAIKEEANKLKYSVPNPPTPTCQCSADLLQLLQINLTNNNNNNCDNNNKSTNNKKNKTLNNNNNNIIKNNNAFFSTCAAISCIEELNIFWQQKDASLDF